MEKSPQVKEWSIHPSVNSFKVNQETQKTYNGLYHIRPNSIIPIVSAFQDQATIGFYSHLGDPNFIHDIKVDVTYSPKFTNKLIPRFHFDIKYQYKLEWLLRYQHNASNFFDLVNKLKRSTIQKKITIQNTHYWLYDEPHKIKHVNDLSAYFDAQYINDNTIRIYKPNFIVYQSVFESSNLRRSIGSIDAEKGVKWGFTIMTYHVDPKNFQHVGGVHGECAIYTTWGWPHNTVHFKVDAGIRHTRNTMAIGWFYFGGFGNRYLENEDVNQFRKTFRFPGIPIYDLPANRFLKTLIEQKLPPLRFGNAYIQHHCLNYTDLSVFTQALATKLKWQSLWLNAGAQVNLHFRHWYNLESTLSFGIAKAWNVNQSSWEWFISFKPLRS